MKISDIWEYNFYIIVYLSKLVLIDYFIMDRNKIYIHRININ